MNKTKILSSIIIATLLIPQTSWALKFVTTSKLSATEKTAAHELFQQAEARLPEKIKKEIGTLNVDFTDLRSSNGMALGKVLRNSILLSKKLLPELVAGPARATPTKNNRQHANMYQEALATLLHETVHIYDNLNLHSKEEQAWIRKCNPHIANEKQEKSILAKLPAMCRYYRNMNRTFSQNPYFLNVSGFTQDSFNGYKERSPDLYELTDNRESLAVNMEFFLMDSEFKCRRPTMYRLLAGTFAHIPFKNITCERTLNFILPSTANEPATFMSIDPDRVYQIHYLLAAEGDAMMSNWGHAMVRLVICAPEQPVVGPACLGDTRHHLVLSYRAFVNSLSINSLDGMVGNYPSRLFILPLNQVIEEYTKGELRALKSVPFKFNRQQIREFLERAVESHWAYDGKYYFVSNNCATETLNLLRSSIFEDKLLDVQIKSPVALYQTLARKNYLNTSVLDDLKQARTQGFYFDSLEIYNWMYRVISENVSLNEKDFKEYLKLSALERRRYMKKLTPQNPKFRQVIEAFSVLERAAAYQHRAKMMGALQNAAVKEMEAAENSKQSGGRASQVAENFLEISQMFAKPSFFLREEKGYGLPILAERDHAAEIIAQKSQKALEMRQESMKISDELISLDDQRELAEINENAKLLLELKINK